MTSVVERIGQWAASERSFSTEARERARHAIADTIACMVAGAADPAVQAVKAASGIQSGGGASFVGGGRGAAPAAALINGTAAHALDFDDNFHPARAHASAVLVPALLAAAASRPGTTGREVVDAYLVGLQAQAIVGWGVNPSHYNAGWHGTSTVGCIGSAAGVARLLGLDGERIGWSMSVAASFASGPKGQFGTPAKPLHAGIAARNAVDSAFLARSGMRGRPDILEGPQGFLDLFGGKAPRGWDEVPIPGSMAIETHGLVVKRHPCCGSTHRAIDAILELQAEHGFSAEDVAAIDIRLGVAAFRNLPYPEPADEMEARFSMPYCIAAALLQGRLRLEDFTLSAVRRPQVRAIMPKVGMTAYSEQEEQGVDRLPHIVTVSLRDGRRHRQVRMHAKGSSRFPLSEVDRALKFQACCRPSLSAEIIETLQRMIDHLDDVQDAVDVAELAFGSPGTR